jgi:hypothetical protein
VGGFDGDGVFRIRKALPLDFSNSGFTSTADYTLSDIVTYSSRDITGDYYCNQITVYGSDPSYISNNLLARVENLTMVEIGAGKTFFYEIMLDDVVVVDFFSFASGNFPKPLTRPPVNSSYFGCFDSDDDKGVLVSTVTVVSSSLAVNSSGDEIILLKLYNSGSASVYLKSYQVYGNGVRYSTNRETRQDIPAQARDGKISKEVTSRAIQGVRVQDVATICQLNLQTYADVYSFEARALPQVEIGDIIDIQDYTGTSLQCVLLDVDSALDSTADGLAYKQLVTAKKLRLDIDFLTCDEATDLCDDINFLCF